MCPDPDDVLRERAAFDDNAAEILRLAVERGLMTSDAAARILVQAVRQFGTTRWRIFPNAEHSLY